MNVNFIILSDCVNTLPAVLPDALTYWMTPSSKPASNAKSINFIADNGVALAGLTINVLPAATAGAAFLAIIATGKFHGVMAATSPIG